MEMRHEVLVVARPVMCEAGREEPFDELPSVDFMCRVTPALRNSRKISETGKYGKPPFFASTRATNSAVNEPVVQCRHFLMVDIVRANRRFLPILQKTKLRQLLFS